MSIVNDADLQQLPVTAIGKASVFSSGKVPQSAHSAKPLQNKLFLRTNTHNAGQYANQSLRGAALTPLQQISEMTPDNTPIQRKSRLNNEVYQLVQRLNNN